jgi:hypothetical protein
VARLHLAVGERICGREREDHCVEQEQRALFEQRAAELAGPGRRDLDDGVREAGERAVRAGGDGEDARAEVLRQPGEVCTVTAVSPEAEKMTRPSSSPIAGAVGSPTAWTSKPACIRRIAVICATSPERPCPEQNQRRPRSASSAMAAAICSLDTADSTP